jgi:porin
MPLDILTNTLASSASSIALLLNPTPTQPARSPAAEAPAVEASAEHLLGNWGGIRSRLVDHGYEFTVQYVGEVMGDVSGGVKRGTVYNGLLNLAADADLEKAAGWKGATVHLGGLVTHGRSITDNYVHDLFVAGNLDASDNARLFELWLEQRFANGKLSVRLGQIAVDQEFAFTAQGTLFNNSAFGWFPIVGATAAVYPQGAPGVRVKWSPTKKTYVQALVVDGDANPSDANGNETNPNGINYRLDEGAFAILEGGCNWELHGKAGSAKLAGWYHTARHDDLRRDTLGLSLADPGSSGTARSHSGNYGFYAGAEQLVWGEKPDAKDSAEGLGVFGRLGYAAPDRNTLDFYAEVGCTCTGLIPSRDEDVCGLGIAYGKMSAGLRGLGRDQNAFNSTSDPLPDHEIAIECEYQCKVWKGFTVQPGLQYIIHPGGSAAIADALLIGLRTVFDF